MRVTNLHLYILFNTATQNSTAPTATGNSQPITGIERWGRPGEIYYLKKDSGIFPSHPPRQTIGYFSDQFLRTIPTCNRKGGE